MDKVTIFNDDGDDLTITKDALQLQCTLLEVVRDNDQANRRSLLAVLKRLDDLLNALDNLTNDKGNAAKITQYQAAKRGCETDILYYGKCLRNRTEAVVQGSLFADAAT